MSERHPSQQEQKDSQTAAEQRFMHGLLSYLHRQDDEAREARIQRVMHAVTQESDSTQTPSVLRFTTTLYQHWKSVSSLAAAAIIVFALFLFSTILPTGPSAYAVVQTSLSAASTAGAHRYNIYAALPHEENIGETAIATLDIADADHHVFILTRPRGGQLVTGCNEDGTWAIRRDGAIERYRPGMARPRWAAIGQMTIFASSIDDLIDEFGDLYDFTFGADDAIEGQPTVSYTRVTATYRDPETSPDSPARFEFWIAPDTQMIQRLEIYWDLPTPQEQQTLGRGEREGRMPRRPGPLGEGANADPLNRRQPPDRRPMDAQPPGDRLQRRPEGEGPTQEFREEFMGFLDGPPRFDRQGEQRAHQPIPPRLIVYELVPPPTDFTPGWFDPETHQPAPDGG